MYLKRLELQGFKSFPEKVRLDFNKGITAVVGPNGSGKSNVADAVRWVLGEQSAKSLRGAKMEDIIFVGTQNRRPLNFAEVCMVIDNSDYEMATEFSEITVTRRVYRSGESQYMINGVTCRLKDIHELFMDTGVGREGYSVIGQGRIEEILSAKSEDRRLLFEEAAGIVKYKNRKTEAEAKLERERQNLVRINDIISELELQIGPLFEQSETAKQYLNLAERQKLLNVNMFLTETQNAQSVLEKITANIENVKNEIDGITEQSAESKAKTGELKNKIAEMGELIENKTQSINELILSIEKCENQIKLCQQNSGHMDADIERLRREAEGKRNLMQSAGDNIKAYEDKQSAILLEYAGHNENLKTRQDELSVIDEKLRESEQLIEQYNAGHIENIRSTTDIRERISRAETMYEQLEERKEELDEERDAVQAKLEQSVKGLEYLKDDLSKKDAQINYLSKQIEDLFEEKNTVQQEIADEKAELDKTEKSYNQAFSRHKLLCELEQSYEGYYKSVKSVLLAKKQNPQQFTGIHGAVADLLSLEHTYETAVEIALGGALQNIVTDNEKAAQEAIEFLKQRKDGRATFLPISAVNGKEFSNKDQLLREIGVVGVAKELISYDPIYEGIFSSLLGRVLVVDNLNNAVVLSKKYRHELKIVTLEGDLLNPGGSMTGGSINKSTASILSRGGEIAALKDKIDRLTEQKEGQSRRLVQKNDRLNGISDLIEKNKMLVQEVELSKANLAANLKQAEQAIAELNEKKENFDTEERQLMEQIVELNRQNRQLREEQKALELEIADILGEMERMQKTANDFKIAKDQKIKELTRIQANISSLNESLAGIKENINRIINDINTAEKDTENFQSEIEGIFIKQEDLKKEIDGYNENIAVLTAERDKTQNIITGLQNEKQNLQKELDDNELLTVEKIETVSKLSSELARLEMNLEQREADSRKWFDLMWDEYGLTHQAALKLPKIEGSLSSLQKEEREVKNAIKALGMVNVAAIEEYKTVTERYEFLTGQRNDILAAEGKLLDIIKELEALMERQFSEQFDIISENFGIVFAEMFGGGSAYLKLSDENDVLNSGIEIIAQPPGKRLQNMNLFSGGERALTATTLLFAILRIKPSPFCILDEVEAALDDANVKRYANYLKNFAHKTQFIIITHRKGTMEAADVLYGVTMQEQGISKLVSVKFSND